MARVRLSKGAAAPVAHPPEIDAALCVRRVEKAVVVDLAPNGTATTDALRVATIRKNIGPQQPLVIALRDSVETRAAIAKEDLFGFTMPAHAGMIFASSEPVIDKDRVTLVVKQAPHARILKDTGEERFVLGEVLVPDTVDAQKDIYSAEEVRKAAHGWMEQHGNLGKQHSEIVTGKLKVLESYVAPTDFTVGDQTVKKGTWVMAIRVVDDDLWSDVKKGSFTGFSIGGTAVRTPEATTT